jgi:hypothetical protein
MLRWTRGSSHSRSWQQLEDVCVGGAHDAEVAAIDCRYLCDVESFGGRDNRSVNGAKRKVVVLRHKAGYSYQVTGVNWLEREVASREVT